MSRDWDEMLERARGDRPGHVDVRARVMATIAELPPPRGSPLARWLRGRDLEPSIVAAAGLSVLAALAVGFVALPYLDAVFDPMLGMIGGPELELP